MLSWDKIPVLPSLYPLMICLWVQAAPLLLSEPSPHLPSTRLPHSPDHPSSSSSGPAWPSVASGSSGTCWHRMWKGSATTYFKSNSPKSLIGDL